MDDDLSTGSDIDSEEEYYLNDSDAETPFAKKKTTNKCDL